jgi:hypothetical protein
MRLGRKSPEMEMRLQNSRELKQRRKDQFVGAMTR